MRSRIAIALIFGTFFTPLLAQARGAYKSYRSVFEISQHVDGSPLLIDGRFEYYLFPDAKREKTPDRSTSCSTRFFVQSINFVASMIRSAARSHSR